MGVKVSSCREVAEQPVSPLNHCAPERAEIGQCQLVVRQPVRVGEHGQQVQPRADSVPMIDPGHQAVDVNANAPTIRGAELLRLFVMRRDSTSGGGSHINPTRQSSIASS